MESAVEFEVGPYRFSRQDAEKTMSLVGYLFDSYPEPAQPYLADRRHALQLLGDEATGDAELAVAVERGFALILGARQALVDSGMLPAPASGVVEQINVSDGGVPKAPIDEATVDYGGVVGDRQATRAHHGRPWQALCLWSADVIDAFRREGHPIEAGSAGENITIRGLDWSTVVPGSQLRIGSALVQVSTPAVPCARNRRWFHDGDIDRIHHHHGPNSRLYATVIEPGTVCRGDAAVLEPQP